jgi:hypothetical protein
MRGGAVRDAAAREGGTRGAAEGRDGAAFKRGAGASIRRGAASAAGVEDAGGDGTSVETTG